MTTSSTLEFAPCTTPVRPPCTTTVCFLRLQSAKMALTCSVVAGLTTAIARVGDESQYEVGRSRSASPVMTFFALAIAIRSAISVDKSSPSSVGITCVGRSQKEQNAVLSREHPQLQGRDTAEDCLFIDYDHSRLGTSFFFYCVPIDSVGVRNDMFSPAHRCNNVRKSSWANSFV